jgi:hypothetical protein
VHNLCGLKEFVASEVYYKVQLYYLEFTQFFQHVCKVADESSFARI